MLQSLIQSNSCVSRAFSLSLCVLLFVGCVKENREACPCRLIVDLGDVDPIRIESVDIRLSSAKGFSYETSREAESYATDDVILVPRDEVFLNVYHADSGMMKEDGLLIPEGEDCPPVYMCSYLVSTQGQEYVRKSVRMLKNHCVMTIYLEGEQPKSPYNIFIKGNVCGYDSSGSPRKGVFCSSPRTVSESVFDVILPRQVDASLVLEINDDGEIFKTFALGEYVKACGYSWSEDNLKDITVRIDYAISQVVIAVKGWEEVYEFDIVI